MSVEEYTLSKEPGRKVESREKYTSKILLRFFRHGEKEKKSNKTILDADIDLTSNGKKESIDASETMNINQAVAFGSPRIRTQMTAALVMAGNSEAISGDETLKDLQKRLGNKIRVDTRLDFKVELDGEYGKELYKEYRAGRYLKFLVERSDLLAKQYDDKNSATYSRNASRIAEIIYENIIVAEKWDRIVSKRPKKYTDTLEKFFSSHEGVLESFLAKIIELTQGVEQRDAFVKINNNHAFAFLEEFKVISILNKGHEKDPILKILYKEKRIKNEDGAEIAFKFNEEIPISVIKSIIKPVKNEIT